MTELITRCFFNTELHIVIQDMHNLRVSKKNCPSPFFKILENVTDSVYYIVTEGGMCNILLLPYIRVIGSVVYVFISFKRKTSIKQIFHSTQENHVLQAK